MPTTIAATRPRLRLPHRFACLCLALVLTWLPVQAIAAAASDDALLGRWWGEAGTDKETVGVGLDISRADDGSLRTLLTQPVMNYFGVDVGAGEFSDRTLTIKQLHLSLRLDGDTLQGHFPGPNSPARLQRVDALPQASAPPDLPPGPEPRWHTRLGGQVYASPVVFDGIVYVGSTGGVLNAVDASDGRIVWTHSTGSPIHGAVAVDADAVYVAADNGVLQRLDRASGKPVWRYELGGGDVPRVLPHPAVFDWDWQGAQPLLADGLVMIGSADGSFHAVDAESGASRWRFATRGKIRVGAALDGDRVVIGSDDHFIYALDRASGREIWRFDSGAAIDATPVVHDGRVLVGNRGYGLHALAADTGELQWKQFWWGSWVESTPVVVDGVIYIGASDLRRVSATDPATGRVLWRSDVYGWNWGTPLVIGDRIIVGAAGGAPYFIRHVASLSTLDRATGRLLTRRPLADSGGHQWGIAGSPVRAGESFVVATIDGGLLGFPIE